MKPLHAIVVITAFWLMLTAAAIGAATWLVVKEHPVFGVLAGCFALLSAIAATEVKVTQK